MMKYQTPITTALAALLVVPLFAQDKAMRTLQNALLGTTRALDSLEKIQERIKLDPLSGIEQILAATETPVLQEQQQDERLQTLRNEVNQLQMQLDSLEIGKGNFPDMSEGSVPTTGIDDNVRRALLGLTKNQPQPDLQPRRQTTVLPEGPEYSADPIAQSRTFYRLSRYTDAVSILMTLPDDPKALYWKARSLEKLERVDEAIEALKKVVELAPDSHEGKRAQTDIEFLSWKSDFKRKLPKGVGSSSPSAGGQK